MDVENRLKKVCTLAFISNENDEILLGWKKRGFGSEKWNGFGGKVDKGETVVNAAVREIEEECGLIVKPSDMTQFAVIDFEFVGDPVILQVHVFRCTKFEGMPTESNEMRPKWFPLDNAPHDQMWIDDKIWYPYYRSGTKFHGYFLFEGHSKILEYEITDYDDPSIILEKKSL